MSNYEIRGVLTGWPILPPLALFTYACGLIINSLGHCKHAVLGVRRESFEAGGTLQEEG